MRHFQDILTVTYLVGVYKYRDKEEGRLKVGRRRGVQSEYWKHKGGEGTQNKGKM